MVIYEDRDKDVLIKPEDQEHAYDIVDRFMYYPFGMKWEDVWPLGFNPPDIEEENRHLYNSNELHQESGLYDYGFRYYLAEIGRFSGVDPLAEITPDRTSYRYAYNNPLAYIDPDGLTERNVHDDDIAFTLEGENAIDVFRMMQSEIGGAGGDTIPNASSSSYSTFDGLPPRYGVDSQLGLWGCLNCKSSGAAFSDAMQQGLTFLSTNLVPISSLFTVGRYGFNAWIALKFGRPAAKGVTAPKGWITQASKKGGGTVFKDPSNPHNIIRQMPGNPNSPNVLQQNPYVKFMKDGKFYDVNGKVLPNGNVPGAHIPLNQFDISKMPKF